MNKFYMVIGRMAGDDEDTALAIWADSSDTACDQFRQLMWAPEGCTPKEIQELESSEQGVFITHVLFSESPINQQRYE